MGPKRKGTEVRHSLIPMTFPMKAACKNILDLLKKDEHAKPFLHPVDPDELNLPDYFMFLSFIFYFILFIYLFYLFLTSEQIKRKLKTFFFSF